MTREIGNNVLISKLGEGGMAEVWLGEHKRNRRKAAIKILKLGSVPDEDFERVFLREAQVLAGLDHPNIVRIYDNDRIGDEAYLAMELLSGGTLQQRMRRGPICVGEAISLVVQIASALKVAHAQQLIHRDLKPANVMFRADAVPVLTDFGAVRVLDQSTIFGRDGGVIGTPQHMSP
jgi:serine/threonine-protein kinase PpkA